jgi:carbon-monoxide dehydrogenase large subunit
MGYVGQSMKRFEDPRLLIGNGAFVGDLALPDMLHAAVARSQHAHARLRSVDVSVAAAVPGVVAVLTGADIAGVLPGIPTRAMTGERAVDAMQAPNYPLLAHDKVCYVGQPLAIVVAYDPYIARDAIDLITVDYEPLAPVLDPLEAARDDAPVIHEAMGTNVAMRLRQQAGDVEGAFEQAHHMVQQRYVVHRVVPAPLETRGVLAQYEAKDDFLTVWNATQAPHRVKHLLVDLLQRPESTIRVVAPDVGGSFGVKDCLFPEDVLVPYLAIHLKRPVRWIEDRRDNMLAYHGRGHTIDLEAAVRRDGVLLGIRVDIVADIGAYFLLTTPSAPFNVCRRMVGPYHIPAVSIELKGVLTNKTSTGAYRGTGSPEAAFGIERTMDLIAHDLGIDPAEVRRRNFIPPTAFPYRSATDLTYDSGNYAQGLERLLERLDYPHWRAKARQQSPDEPLLGIGLATFLKSSGAAGDHRIESAQITLTPSGEVIVYTGISPHGQGSETAFVQLVADALGVHPDQVLVRHSDTALFAFGEGTSASRGLIVGGSAVHTVAQDARQHLAHLASELLGCPAQNIDFQHGLALNRHQPGHRLALSQLVAAAAHQAHGAMEDERGLVFRGTYTLPDAPFSFGAHAVVVEVSRETGQVTIRRYVGIHDCGCIINPRLVEGQIIGGIAQGLTLLVNAILISENRSPFSEKHYNMYSFVG